VEKLVWRKKNLAAVAGQRRRILAEKSKKGLVKI
jgi:hypothetical protein